VYQHIIDGKIKPGYSVEIQVLKDSVPLAQIETLLRSAERRKIAQHKPRKRGGGGGNKVAVDTLAKFAKKREEKQLLLAARQNRSFSRFLTMLSPRTPKTTLHQDT
jgi:hypothetical protein